MMKWKEERVIPVNIEKVWDLFADENLQSIMPNVVEHRPIEKKEGVVGSTYQQSYKEGKRIETYIVKYTEYEDTGSKKHKKFGFTLGKAFEIETAFTLNKIDEMNTSFIYEGQNKGINFLGKVMLKIAGENNNKKVVKDFMNLVEKEAVNQSSSA